MIKKISLATLLSVIVSVQALAHDLWIHASDFKPTYNKIATPTVLYAGYGHHYPVDAVYEKENGFTLYSPDNKVKVIKEQLLGYQVLLKEKGNYIVSGETKLVIWTQFTNSKGEKSWRQESKKDLKNVITSKRMHKYAKGIITVGDTDDKNYAKVIGSTLEFIPLENPNNIKTIGQELQVKVLFKGKLLANTDVYGAYAGFSNKGEYKLLGKTNSKGVATIALDHLGYWILKVEHKEPALKEFKNDFDNEFYRATLTFQI